MILQCGAGQAAQPQRSIPLRVKKGGKRRLSPLQAAMRHAVQLVGLHCGRVCW